MQHAEPGIAKLLEHGQNFVYAFARLLQIAFEQAALKKSVEVAERVGELAAGFEIQRTVQFAEDVHGVLHVIVDGGIAFTDIGAFETEQRPVQRKERAIKQHQHQLAGRRGLGCNPAVRFPRIGGWHGVGGWVQEIRRRLARNPASWFKAASEG